MIYNNLTEFINGCDISRKEEEVEIIVSYYDGKDFPEYKGEPVRLLGFITDSSLSDYKIYEEGWCYYKKLVDKLKK